MAEINTTTLTNTGNTGVFDVLLSSLESRLANLISNGHIGTKEYADIYAASLSQVLAQSIQYTLTKPINEAQSDLLIEQLETQKNQTLILAEQVTLAGKEVIKADKEISLLDQKLLSEVAQTDLITNQAALSDTQKGLITQQIAESVSKVALSNAQKLLIDANVLKATEEKELLKQKVVSERAQTEDDLADNSPVAGVIGKQKTLYDKQATGFDRDAMYKVMKLMNDTWAVQRGTNTNEDTLGTGFDNTNKEAVVKKVFQELNIPFSDLDPAP